MIRRLARCHDAKSSASLVATILVLVVALEHLWFLVLEMFLWTQPLGLKTFGLTPEQAQATASLAANQGLYNGFLAAGLAWGARRRGERRATQLFFLGCVLVAAVFGAATASPAILAVQGGPAAIAMVAVLLARRAEVVTSRG